MERVGREQSVGRMQRTVESMNFHGAVLGRVAMLVRGDQVFSVPVAELEELAEVVSILCGETVDGESTVVEQELDTILIEEAAEELQAEEDVAVVRPGRRGRMWKGVRAYLEGKDRACGYKTLLALVRKEGLTDRDPEHALKILLGRKVNSGELELTPSGRYRLVEERERQRGNVWSAIRSHLSELAAGASLEELVEAAETGQWSRARSTRSAVTRALKRYAEEMAFDGRVYTLL